MLTGWLSEQKMFQNPQNEIVQNISVPTVEEICRGFSDCSGSVSLSPAVQSL